MTLTPKTATRLAALPLVLLLAACVNGEGGSMATGAGTGAGAAAGAGTGGGAVSAAQLGANGAAPGGEEDLAKNVGDRVYFGFDKSQLTPDGQATLGKQAAWLQQYPTVHVLIAGSTDPRGTEEYNIALGQRRASAARDYLAAKGIPQSRVRTISYGKERLQPGGECESESCYAQDRVAVTSVGGN